MRCLMNGLEVNYPCSPICALFGDCVTAFEALKKANVQTHGDKIRAMSDEELAKSLDRILSCGGCPIYKNCVCDMPCEDALLNWLKEPAEE